MNEIVVKTLKIDKDLVDRINKLAKKSQRDFSKQVRYMLEKYLDIIEE